MISNKVIIYFILSAIFLSGAFTMTAHAASTQEPLMFFCANNPVSKKYESEDYGFCQLWRSLGGKIHVLPDIKLSHTGRNHYPTDMVGQSRLFIAK